MNFPLNTILQGDTLKILRSFPDECVDSVITSPPYWGLRDYGVEGQLGLEKTLDEFLNNMLAVTAELKRVLKKTGTMFWNHGDNYGTGSIAGSQEGSKQQKGYEKSLMLQAHRLAIRMVDGQGWILRNTLIWHKPNAMPSSVKDRFGVDYEPVFFFTKSKKYWFEQQFENSSTGESNSFNIRVRATAHGRAASRQYKATEGEITKYAEKKEYGGGDKDGNVIGTPGKRGMRTVWTIPTSPFSDAHFATFPEDLVVPMVKAGCPEGGVCLDPFMGAGTTAVVAKKLGRNYIGVELNPEYIAMANKRITATPQNLFVFPRKEISLV